MAAAGQPPSVSNTFGSAYIGAMIMMILYGITCLQTYMIFIRYPKDSASTKWLSVMVSLHSLSSMFSLLTRLKGHGNFSCCTCLSYDVPLFDYELRESARIIRRCLLSLGTNVAIAFVVQCFFTFKIHGLSGKNWWLTGPILVVVVLHLGFGMETMAEFFVKKQLNRLPELTYIAALPFAIAAVLSDIAITGALCYLLQHNRTSFKSTNKLIDYLIIYAINRCLLTSVMAVVEVIVFVTLPGTFWFLAIDFVIGKCYANSLLATLNSRSALRGKGYDTEGMTISSSDEGVEHTGIEIAHVTPSMLSRSRAATQNGQVSLNFDVSRSRASRTTETESMELKEMKTPTKSRTHTTISVKAEESTNTEDDAGDFRTL
ncbi:hypothetical protein M0805_000553 [Coniferiporia weirii]|nr:hypothetical protein M0805_000553 [Coniferiporia weirii]